jgi:hypothetical protein
VHSRDSQLRGEHIRVYYDVDGSRQLVVVFGIVPKSESASWLADSSAERLKGDDQ